MKLRSLFGIFVLCGPLCLAAMGHAAAQTAGNLLPDLDNPKLKFTTGRVVNNKPEMSPVAPNLPGDSSQWEIAEFTPVQALSGDRMRQNDPATSDAVFGPASYAFDAPDSHAHVWIYRNKSTGHLVYELFESGGSLGKGGGSDILLAANLNKPFPTMDHRLNFSMQSKISRADARYDNPQAMHNGAVLAQVGMAFILQFPSPVNGAASTLFLQVSLAHSGEQALQGLPGKAPFIASCTLFGSGSLGLMTVGTLSGVTPLVFRTDTGPMHEISFSINDYLARLFATPISCASKGQGSQMVALASVPLSKVVLKHVYIGPETEIADHRKNSTNTAPQGQADMAIQVSDLRVTEGGN
jgi:hypothetical protein